MDQDDLDKLSFMSELRRIAGVSEQRAEAAWFSVSAHPTMAPERQAKIYANLYGLDKNRR